MHRTYLIAPLFALLAGCSQPVPLGAPPANNGQTYPDLIPAEQIMAQFDGEPEVTQDTATALKNRGDGLRRRTGVSN